LLQYKNNISAFRHRLDEGEISMIKSGSSWFVPLALALMFGAAAVFASSQSPLPTGDLFGSPIAVVSDIFNRF
jgi:hypothetical protein|tara:strand:+ start:265 stop:483 length:219 start_codon:yes stop_codon:yes gene_type:complete